MRTSGAGTATPAGGRRRRGLIRRITVLVALAAAVIQVQQSPAPAQLAPVGGAQQARICEVLRRLDAAFAGNGFVRQALGPLLTSFGCGPAQPNTTSPASTTTTTTHVDCPLPGGGVGPCPTTTFTTFPIPTLPPGVTTIAPPTTILPPCPSTTVPTSMPSTTIPCQS